MNVSCDDDGLETTPHLTLAAAVSVGMSVLAPRVRKQRLGAVAVSLAEASPRRSVTIRRALSASKLWLFCSVNRRGPCCRSRRGTGQGQTGARPHHSSLRGADRSFVGGTVTSSGPGGGGRGGRSWKGREGKGRQGTGGGGGGRRGEGSKH